MDAWMQEIRHQMEFWLWRLTSLLFITASFGALAGTEVVKPLEPPEIYWSGLEGALPTAEEACRAAASGNVAKFTFNSATCIQWNLPHTLCAANCAWTYTNFLGGIVWLVEGQVAQVRLCPKPKVHPETPYYFWFETEECMRPSFNDYSITLTSGAEVEPSNGSTIKTLPFIATVIDQSGQPTTSPVKVQISAKVDPASGGHSHVDSNRPRGGVANVKTCPSDDECWSNTTDENGQVVFNFNAPEASGKYTITATCDGCGNTETKSVDVKVKGLQPIPSSDFYTFIGDNDKHANNHYLTPEAAAILWQIAVSYQFEQQFKLQDTKTMKYTIAPPILHVNDASLTWGGLFDIAGKWGSPHVEHRRGTVVDVRANNADTAIPTQNFKAFKLLAADYGADAHFESPSIERRHVHLRLLNREE